MSFCSDDLQNWLKQHLEIRQDQKFRVLTTKLLADQPRAAVAFQARFLEGKKLTDIGIVSLGGRSKERARQLSLRALRMLTHPTRMKILIENGYSFDIPDEELRDILARAEPPLPAGLQVPIEELPIEKMEISFRLYNCLTEAGITTAKDLIENWSENDLMGLPNFGRKTFHELKEVLAYYKLPPLRRT